ncbi:hypothetical protein [Marinimicrobium locisalis]|uniref:hypothetical protein n=1 Tax=Marinimicrobium locisalis TaxID=546022 RepID=UPI00322153CE
MKKWSETRKMGKRAFVWKTWVFFWGVGTAVAWSLIMNFIQPAGADRLLPLIGFIIFPLTGFFAGNVMWALNERKHSGEPHNEKS